MSSPQVKFTIEQEMKIISLYKDGYGSQTLGRQFGVSSSRILLILNKHNIKRNGNKFSNKSLNINKIKMVEMYNDGYTLSQIGQVFDIFPNAVKSILLNRGVVMRKAEDYSKIKFNTDFFKFKTNELAYFYGFVLGDGTYSSKSGVPKIKIGIHLNDVDSLKMMCDWFSFPKESIFYYKNKKVVELIIRDSILGKNKKYWGVIENKTYNPIIPKLRNKSLLKYFLIGLIDADGHVSYKRNKHYLMDLVGNKKIMDWVKDMLIYLGYKGAIRTLHTKGKVWSRIRVQRKQDLFDLAKVLGVENCDFLMKRKWSALIESIKNNTYFLGGRIIPSQCHHIKKINISAAKIGC